MRQLPYKFQLDLVKFENEIPMVPIEHEPIHLFSPQMVRVLPKEYFYKRLLFYWIDDLEKNKITEKFLE